MKTNRTPTLLAALGAIALLAAPLKTQAITYTVDPGATWLGYMNVFNVGGTGLGMAGAGGFVFDSGWGTADLRASFAGPVLSLQANTIGDPDPFWYTPSGGPGSVGNKIMDANFYQQFDGPLAGQNVTFTGTVLGNGLLGPVDAAGRGWTAIAFIKDFAPDFSSSVTTSVALTSLGDFSLNYTAISDPLRHVQFGFQVIGPNVWAGDPLSLPSITITAIPEPSTFALAGLSAAALLIFRRRK